MLKQENRLKKKKDFESIFKHGKSFREGFLLFKFVKNELEESRFGFVVGKKISKKAVERNKVQRRIKFSVKNVLDDLNKKIDGVFIAFPGIEQQKTKDIQKSVERLFEKAFILKK